MRQFSIISRQISCLRYGVLGLAFCFVTGCNQGPKLINFVGKVNVDGQPTEGIGLIFFDQTSRQVVASAKSESGGTFTVMTQDRKGIPEGKYLVSATYPDPKFVAPPTFFGEAPKEAPDLFKGRYLLTTSDITLEVTSSTVDPIIELKLK